MWSAPVTLTPPVDEPVTLAEAKQFVSIEPGETEFDGQLSAFILAAREQLEAVTGTRVMPQELALAAGCWSDLARLPVGPVSAITSIHWEDAAGAVVLLDPAVYELAGTGLSRSIRLKPGASWPSGLRRAEGAIRVVVDAGYDAVPGPLWTAILLMVGDQFAHRESAVVGTIAAKVPSSMAVDALLANFRIWL